jgi:hypothetical protein
MQGKSDENSIYRLEQQFWSGESIKIIRSQVEKYKELVHKQTERLERAKAISKDLN